MLKLDNVIPPTDPEFAAAALRLIPLNAPAATMPTKDDSHFSSRVSMPAPIHPTKTAPRNMLREAVENTAKMTPRGE